MIHNSQNSHPSYVERIGLWRSDIGKRARVCTHWRQIVENLKGFGSDQTLAKRCKTKLHEPPADLTSTSMHMTSHQRISSDGPSIQLSKMQNASKCGEFRGSWCFQSSMKPRAPRCNGAGWPWAYPRSRKCKFCWSWSLRVAVKMEHSTTLNESWWIRKWMWMIIWSCH